MIEPTSLLNSLMLETNPISVAAAISSERSLLRRSYGSLESITIAALTEEVTLANDTVDVLFVGFNRKPLFSTVEIVLNAITSQWRIEIAEAPTAYIYRSEQPLQTLRLHPIPREAGTLEVIKLIEPPESAALWHNAFITLGALARLSAIDPLRARPEVIEIAAKLQELLYEPFKIRSIRASRR